jgi:MFS family permease
MTNVALKRMTPRIFFTVIIIAWGVVMTLMGLVTSYGGLLAARFALGLAEAGLYPGYVQRSYRMERLLLRINSANYYLSCWYKRSELGIRTATFFAMAAIAGSFGGLLAAAISLMEDVGGRPGWAWIVSALEIQ